MKTTILLALVFACHSALAQAPATFPAVDKSPMDMSYYPIDYPQLKVQDKAPEGCVARVVYSRPRTEGRPIFGELVAYGKLWRLGANEATEIEFYKPVTIAGKKVPKGRYTLYAIVKEKTWTIILNKETDIWGSFKYNASKDLLRVDVPVETLATPIESLAMNFEKVNNIPQLDIAWDTVKVVLPFTP